MAHRALDEPLDHCFVSAFLREAATICLLRDADPGLEVLMVRRTLAARFMSGAWVFPGGAVDEDDGVGLIEGRDVATVSNDASWRAAALRELVEETGIWLLQGGPIVTTERPSGNAVFSSVPGSGERFIGDALTYFANWITPAPLPIRFDTRFFAAVVPPGLEPSIDGEELVDARWIRPAEVLELANSGAWVVAFPTRKIVEFLDRFDSFDGFRRHVDALAAIEPIQPRLSVTNGRIEILMLNEPGFEEAAVRERDPEVVTKMMQIAAAGGDVPPEFRST